MTNLIFLAARAPIRIAFLEDAAVQNATLDLTSDMPSRSHCESSRAGSEIWSLASPVSPTATSPPSPSSSMYAMQSPIKSSVPLSGKPSRPRKSTAQPGHIKRPHNAFFVFKGSMKDKIRRKKDESGKHFNVCAAIIWNGMSDAEKLPFKEQARMLKAEHFQKYPDYKYKPRKKRSTVDTDDEASGSCMPEIPCEDEKKTSFMTLVRDNTLFAASKLISLLGMQTFPLEAINQPDLVPDASTATFVPSVIADNRFPYAIGINWDPSIASGHTYASENPYSLFRPHGFMCTSFPLEVVSSGGVSSLSTFCIYQHTAHPIMID
jgi:hypothetical protein